MTVTKRLWKRLAEVEGFMEGASIFGVDDRDRAYFVDGTQVAHERDGALSLRLTRKVISAHRADLKADDRVELKSGSDWINVHAAGPADDDFVLDLAQLAADAHRPQQPVTLKPPPTGADLARRRRFH